MKIDDKYGRIAGILLGLALAFGIVLFCAMVGACREMQETRVGDDLDPVQQNGTEFRDQKRCAGPLPSN